MNDGDMQQETAEAAVDQPLVAEDSNQASAFRSARILNALTLVLIALAVVATILMVTSDHRNAMRTALLAWLWAALLGVLLVGRYRYLAESAQRELQATRASFAVELEKEQATHREQELLLENTYRDALAKQHDETLAAIRAELAEVRATLSAITGAAFEYEPAAVTAKAVRLSELDNPKKPVATRPTEVANQAEAAQKQQRVGEQRVAEREALAAAAKAAQELAERQAREAAARQAQLEAEERARKEAERKAAQEREAAQKEAERKEAERKEAERKEAERLAAEKQEAARKEAARKEAELKEAERKQAEQQAADRPSELKPAATVTVGDPQPQEPAPSRRGGRRRRDEHADALSVADLLASLKQKS